MNSLRKIMPSRTMIETRFAHLLDCNLEYGWQTRIADDMHRTSSTVSRWFSTTDEDHPNPLYLGICIILAIRKLNPECGELALKIFNECANEPFDQPVPSPRKLMEGVNNLSNDMSKITNDIRNYLESEVVR